MRRTALFLAFVLAAPAFAAAPPPPPPPPEAPMPPLPEDPPPGFEEWSQQKEREILEGVRRQAPDQYAELMELRDSDPESYRRELRRAGHALRLADDPEAMARLERMRAVESRIDELADGFDQLPAGDQKKRRAEIEKLAGELFDLRQEQRRATVAQLETRLSELKAEIAEREKERDEIIDDWLDRRLDPQPGL